MSDVEAALLYPSMKERPEQRWVFIRKVFSILTLHFLTTIAVAAAVAAVPPISHFFSSTWAGLAVYISIAVALLIVLFFLARFSDQYPHNFILLGIFTLCFGSVLGLATSFISDRVILEAAIATAAVVVSLTLYTFWAARRGQDFGFLVPFIITIVITLLLFTIFQIFFPMGRFLNVIYSGIAVLIFCASIIIEAQVFLEQNSYDDYEYILASIGVYLAILYIFVRFFKTILDIFL